MLKVGDKVKFIHLYMADTGNFNKDRIYTITEDLGQDHFYLNSSYMLYAYGHQLEKVIEDNPMNRLLFPELKPDGKGHLI